MHDTDIVCSNCVLSPLYNRSIELWWIKFGGRFHPSWMLDSVAILADSQPSEEPARLAALTPPPPLAR